MVEALTFEDASHWEAWLATHHGQSAGAWLKVARRGSSRRLITIAEAGDVALCYGWIDSVRRSGDRDHFLQRYSPRRPRSSWSKVNVDRVEALLAAGRMRAPGLTEVAAAKADGRWAAAYASQRDATVPTELVAALKADARAKRAFDRLDKTDQYLLILPLLKARTAPARAARVRTILGRLEDVREG